MKHFDLFNSIFILESSIKTPTCLQKYVFGIFGVHLKKTCIMPKEVIDDDMQVDHSDVTASTRK